MISFILISIILILLAAYFIVPTLLKPNYIFSDEYDDLNVSIAKDRLKEIKLQRESGEITEDTFQQLHDELETVLALDISNVNQTQPTNKQNLAPKMKPITAIFIALTIPVVAAGTYSQLGNIDAAAGNVVEATQQAQVIAAAAKSDAPQMTMDEAVAGLEKRMQEEPDNADGWFMLARSYMSIKKYDKAKMAYEKTIAIVGDNPELLLRYVDAIAMTEGGNLAGKAKLVLDKVIKAIPNNPMVLWLSGTAESQLGNHKKALSLWYKLIPVLADKPKEQAQLKDLISQAESKLTSAEVAELKQSVDMQAATKPTVTSPVISSNVGINVSVSLDPTLKDKVSDDDVLFVFAKALTGPPMPLAAVKKTVADLPLVVTLNDAMAMMPQMKLSNFAQVKLSAVISKSGTPGKKAGDLYVDVFPVDVKTKDEIILIINQVK